MQTANTLLLSLIACTGIVVLGVISDDRTDDLAQQQELYCEMVAIHKDTGGQYGWPDYKHIAQRACK